jgi:hypothetical protein
MDLKGILGDLLTLEVNTIIKDGMTANKMPPLPFALLDIASDYGAALAERRVNVSLYFAPSRQECWKMLEGTPHDARAREVFAKMHPGKKPDGAGLLDYVNDLWPVLDVRPVPRLLSQATTFSMEKVDNGWETFERLRIAANHACEHFPDGHDRVVLMRIVGSCSRLKYILQGLTQRPPTSLANPKRSWFSRTDSDGETIEYATLADLVPKTRNQLLSAGLRHKRIPRLLNSDDLSLVRKAWEVGTECVLMQTCVQIDGDVVTRISEELLTEELEKRELIINAHKRSVEIGLSHWQALVKVASELVGNAFRKLVG